MLLQLKYVWYIHLLIMLLKAIEQKIQCGTVNYAVQGGSDFMSVDESLMCDPSKESF